MLAIVELVKLAVFFLFVADNQVVGDVAVGIGGRLPLENDLRGGVGGGIGVQRYRGSCYRDETEQDNVKNTDVLR